MANEICIQQITINKLLKIKEKFGSKECDGFINYMIEKANNYESEINQRTHAKNNTNCSHLFSYFLPREIVGIIFDNISEKIEGINFFITCKYYYEFREIFYKDKSYDFASDSKNLIIPLQFLEISHIKILENVNFVGQIRHFVNLEELTFSDNFNHQVFSGHFPESLKKLTFGEHYTHPIYDLDLPKLEELTLGYYFNQQISYLSFPRSLKKLTFGYKFNRRIHTLKHSNIEILVVGQSFNQHIDECMFPDSLQKIEKMLKKWSWEKEEYKILWKR